MFNGLKKKASVNEMSEMYGLFSEISEDEMMSVNGGCGGSGGEGGKTIGGVSFNGQGIGQSPNNVSYSGNVYLNVEFDCGPVIVTVNKEGVSVSPDASISFGPVKIGLEASIEANKKE